MTKVSKRRGRFMVDYRNRDRNRRWEFFETPAEALGPENLFVLVLGGVVAEKVRRGEIDPGGRCCHVLNALSGRGNPIRSIARSHPYEYSDYKISNCAFRPS